MRLLSLIVHLSIVAGIMVLYGANTSFFSVSSSFIESELLSIWYERDSSFEIPSPPSYPSVSAVVGEVISKKVVPTTVQKIVSITQPSGTANTTISESELWSALSSYRNTHKVSALIQSESLCVYARSRAQELIKRFQSNPAEPLDKHAGFQRDSDSSYVFTSTGFNGVGENLAYTPDFTTAVQVIEWGWDTSQGHKELMLSQEMTHACVTGIHPIYVAIFGRK